MATAGETREAATTADVYQVVVRIGAIDDAHHRHACVGGRGRGCPVGGLYWSGFVDGLSILCRRTALWVLYGRQCIHVCSVT